MTQTFFNGTLSIDWSPYVGHKCELSVGDWESDWQLLRTLRTAPMCSL